jgi:ribonucleoside-diphosphate reductase beta chain
MGIINGNQTDPNKILPIQYPWTRQHYKTGMANHWVPEEISMQDDLEMWKSRKYLTDDERRLILRNVSFFSTAESLTANNLVLALYQHITDPGARQYLLRQAMEESIHTDCFIYCCDTLDLDPEEVYGAYKTIPSIRDKDEFIVNLTKNIIKPDFNTKTNDGIRDLLRDLVGFYSIMEGCMFYAGFAMILGLKRRNKMTGMGQQFTYIMRDEAAHLSFGHDLIQTIRIENPDIWTADFNKEIKSLIIQAIEYEDIYTWDTIPRGIIGLTPQQFCEYSRYIADRRLERLGIPKYYNVKNPFNWMSQATDMLKEANFFERKNHEYQTGGSLSWD